MSNMTTLTTDHGVNFPPEVELLDKTMNKGSCGVANSVVSKLVKCWRQLNGAECNISFFSNLLSRNISTRDVHSFITKQAGLKKSSKDLDLPLSRKAMRFKLNDACSFASRQRRFLSRLKRELLIAMNNKVYSHRRLIKQIRVKMVAEKKLQEENDMKKFLRYASIQLQLNSDVKNTEFQVSASIAAFSEIKAFNPPKNIPKSSDPPLVYDSSIVLSQDEVNLLSKGPKFAVRQALTAENFRVELEKMVSKQKDNDPLLDETRSTKTGMKSSSFYGPNCFQESFYKSCIVSKDLFPAVSVAHCKSEQQQQQVSSSTNGKRDPEKSSDVAFVSTNGKRKLTVFDDRQDLHTEFEQKRSQLVFDFQNGTLDTSRLRATK